MNLCKVGVNRDADPSRFAVTIRRPLVTTADRTVNVYWSGGHCMMDFGSGSIVGLPGGIGFLASTETDDDDPAVLGAMLLVFQLEREAVRVFREDNQRCVVRACGREYRGTKAIVPRLIAFAAPEAARMADFLNGETVCMEVV